MKPLSFMVIAGEISGDLLAADLVKALRQELKSPCGLENSVLEPGQVTLEPYFFGAGGPAMASAGVELEFDLTKHSVTGLSDVIRGIVKFRRLYLQLRELGLKKRPDVIICVDFSGFNRRLAAALRRYCRDQHGCRDWDPKIIQYVSPQVWASREGRAYSMARDYDLLLSILPFERDWYARRVPNFPVEFIGHPLVDRYAHLPPASSNPRSNSGLNLLLLPGSRAGELSRHLPVMRDALVLLRGSIPELRARMVLPNDALLAMAKRYSLPDFLEVRIGGLAQALQEADVALASTGTVTLECAFFQVPTVALYKTSLSTYLIARQIIQVKYLAMPNLLAHEPLFPEFIQHDATAQNLASAARALLADAPRRAQIRTRLAGLVTSLGAKGASQRGAQAILRLLAPKGD